MGTNLAYWIPYCLPSPVIDVVRLVLSAILYPAVFSNASTSWALKPMSNQSSLCVPSVVILSKS